MSNNTQNMQIYTIIGQIEDMVENSPRPKINGGAKRVIDAEELMDLLGDLKVTIPEDIRRANSVIVESQTMIDNADEHARDVVASAEQAGAKIVADANAAAANIVEKARQEYERLVSEDEIYQEAQRRAKLLAQKAEANAGLVYENAKCYADDVLKDLENFLGEYKQLVAINRKDLDARTAQPQLETQPVPAAAPVQPQQQPAHPKRQPKAVEPEDEYYDDDDDFEDDEEKGGSIFSKLFKKKKVEDIDFDDEE